MKTIPNKYFESLGNPKPNKPFGLIDDYRFHTAFRHLAPGSVMDIGTYYGDLLMLARRDGREIYGTEINQERVDFANDLLGEKAVRIGFKNGSLGNFEDNYVDNIVCTEVIEHVPDDVFALSELCRVARKRVIITVPFNEKIKQSLCIHCGKYTPHSGHLHSYDFDTFKNITPRDWVIKFQKHFGKRLTHLIIKWLRLPRSQTIIPFIQVFDSLSIGSCSWLLVVFNKT